MTSSMAMNRPSPSCRKRLNRVGTLTRANRWSSACASQIPNRGQALVQLVQGDSHKFRLQGSHRLRFQQDLTDLEERFAFIENLLENLAAKP